MDANGNLRVASSGGGETILNRLPQLPRFSATQLAGVSLSPEEFDSDGVPHNDPRLHVFTFFADGTYVLGNINDEFNRSDYVNAGVGGEIDEDGGMEWARWNLDPVTGRMTVTLRQPFSETNGSAGMFSASDDDGDPDSDVWVLCEIGTDAAGPFVRFSDEDCTEILKFRVVPSQANSLIGSWTTFSPTDDPDFEPEVITFFSDGSLLAASTRRFAQPDSEAGVERFQWSLNPAGDQFTSTRSLNAYPFCMDTVGPGNSCTLNGGAGESNTQAFSLSVDGRTATFGTAPDTTVLRKVTVP